MEKILRICGKKLKAVKILRLSALLHELGSSVVARSVGLSLIFYLVFICRFYVLLFCAC